MMNTTSKIVSQAKIEVTERKRRSWSSSQPVGAEYQEIHATCPDCRSARTTSGKSMIQGDSWTPWEWPS